MADDITLTVRVRDLTRGEFERLGQRLRGVDEGVRRVGESSEGASERADRLSENIRGVSDRMRDLHQTGGTARHEMTHMRRTMSLLNRDLSNAARSGDLTEEQFRSLSGQLERTRIDFDYLNRDIERHNSVVQAAHREELQRQQAATLARRQTSEAQLRDLRRLQQAAGNLNFTSRFRGVGESDFRPMNTALARMRNTLFEVSGSSDDARRSIDLFGRDLGVVTRVLREAQASGSMTRREFQALSAGLTLMGRNARDLSRSGEMTRATFRQMTSDIRSVRAQMTPLNNSLNNTARSVRHTGSMFQKLIRVAILLSPALIPLGAVAANVASTIIASFGAAAVALGVFGLALVPQIKSLMRARMAQKEYADAVDLYGASSKKARSLQAAYNRVLGTLSPMAREAAVSFGILGEQFDSWGKSLEGETLSVLNKGFAIMGDLLPRLSGLVRGTSSELNRMMTIIGGGIRSNGFKKMMDQFTEFSTKVLARANHALVDFLRNLQQGNFSGTFTGFMAYVNDVGPIVTQTLADIGDAFFHLVEASSDVGLSILQVVSALATIISAIPVDVISVFLQLAFAFKAVALASAAMIGTRAALATFGTTVAASSVAAAGATGALGKLSAAFGVLSKSAKLAVVASVIGILVVALTELSQAAKDPPTNMEKLTLSMTELGRTGKATGEITKLFGKDLEGLDDALRELARPSTMQSIAHFRDNMKIIGDTDLGDLKKKFKEADEALSGLVKSGNTEMAAAAFKHMGENIGSLTLDELMKQLPEYDTALQNVALEQQLAAEAMGLFGAQAMAVQEKLSRQKASADGLRQSIIALNEVNRAASGAMNEFEAAIDATAEVAAKTAGQLKMVNGAMNLDSAPAREAEAALRDLAAKTENAAAAAADQGAAWETVEGIFASGREEFIKMATTMTGGKDTANQLAAAMLNIPDREVWIKMIKDQATTDLNAFNAAVKNSPGSKSVTLTTLSAAAERVLASFGYKVTRLPDGSVVVHAITGGALKNIGNVESRLNNIDGKVAKTYVVTYHSNVGQVHNPGNTGSGGFPKNKATGGIIGAAGGGPRSRLTWVGEQGPELVNLPSGSMVRSNPDSRRMMAQPGGGGVVTIEIKSSGSRVDDMLLEILRKSVRVRGGNVQLVIGGKTVG